MSHPDVRTAERIRVHYEVERELADRLRNSSRSDRRDLYSLVYDELFERVPDHPQLTRKVSAEDTRVQLELQMRFLRHFLRPGITFLEIGAGDCSLSVEIARTARRVYALDVSESISALAEHPANLERVISDGVSIIPELDHALEWCENEIITQHQDRAQEEADLRGWFTRILGSEGDAAELIAHCERLEVEAGETIVRAGEEASSMHFILDGRVGVMVPANADGGMTRVRSLGRYTTIGEMGLVSQAPRSATIEAEVSSVLYVLSRPQFDALKRDTPILGQKLLTYFVSVMAERLSFANRMIAVLRR